MAESADKNPIERRVDYLAGLWNSFAKEPEPRLLRWLVDDDERRLVELLVEMQNEEVGDIPDLFIRFDTPFIDRQTYPLALLRSLKQQYAESRQEIAAANLPTDWQCPSPKGHENGLKTFVQAGASLKEYYRGKMFYVVIFLVPDSIADIRQWNAFLVQLLEEQLPRTLRIMVLDHVDRPILNNLSDALPKLVRTVTPNLDLPGALEEIAETAKGVGPGHEFRKLFVKFSNAAAKANIEAANTLAVKALRIAAKQKWHDLQMAVYMVLGAMHLGRKDTDMALKAYQYAERAANATKASGNPSGAKLLVQSRFAQAGTLIAKENYAAAAPLYESAVPLAKAGNEAFLELEAWRMAAYCYEMDNSFERAWQCGLKALDAGDCLDADLRPNSTLPYVGQRLLGLVRQNNTPYPYARQVHERMVALVGEDWEKRLEVGATAP